MGTRHLYWILTGPSFAVYWRGFQSDQGSLTRPAVAGTRGREYCQVRMVGTGPYSLLALQMKGWCESSINVWFPFMYSQKWNCYFQSRIIMFCSQFLHSYNCERFIYFQDRSAYSTAGNMWTDPGTHECGNWAWGRAIPRKGIHKWGFSLQCGPRRGSANTGGRVRGSFSSPFHSEL